MNELQHSEQIRQKVWDSFDPEFKTDNQVLGRRTPIGCVALEVTQRCNLDCTLCYLSENSESVKHDIPLEEVFKRVDRIYQDFGANTNVQISGGDPTLRKKEELLEIIRYITKSKMRASINTNGILATREYLIELKEAGLRDIAFHVDVTQERKGFDGKTEIDLDRIRRDYVERARGVGINIIFNTTVCDENIKYIPNIIAFVKENCDVVSFASFQMQADTGRGVKGGRVEDLITFENVTSKLEKGLDAKLSWDTVLIGHPQCHRITNALIADGEVIDLFDDPELIKLVLAADTGTLRVLDGGSAFAFIARTFELMRKNRQLAKALPKYLFRKFKQHWRALLRCRFQVRKLTIFCQNFMDAENLNMERIHHCSFKVATADGAISMCLHNSIRDEFILPETRELSRDEVVARIKAREKAAVIRAVEEKAPLPEDKSEACCSTC